MNKGYPPSEFPDLPSFEESLDLWLAEREAWLPRWLQRMLAVMPVIGLCLLASNVLRALSTFAPQPESGLTLADLIFTAGVLLIAFPFIYLTGVRLHLPPKPTRRQYRRTLELLRAHLRHQTKEEKDS
ncbi:hypothetical protein WJ97_13970 [Burkholderia ubonensis]|uniref:hypothetical protein n=1 Tax=Burkholderia ubonensis TaxID=101571 RepID=UPI00075A9E9B|nr:hypothetical protein [Burkholderia ubonensis]KVP96924.1 hypothetical protein WJ97_13970 [Burkholderia ubonensis]